MHQTLQAIIETPSVSTQLLKPQKIIL